MDKNLEKYQNAKFIFMVGIGGSNLASKAVWNAETMHKPGVEKKVFFLESPDSREHEEVENFVKNEIADLAEVVLIAVSKSGETVETLETFRQTLEILSEKFGPAINDRVLVISTPDSSLWHLAEIGKMEHLAWQGDVSGRFSAFTVAHLAILSIAGLDTERFRDGKKEINKDEAEKLAYKIFESYKNGVDILDFFIFNPELEDLGKWCRQLIAESLAILTPTVSLGPTDLHSMLELDLGGPKNHFTIFVGSLAEIKGSINETAYENTVKAYEKEGLPFYKYEMPEINELELGKFMATMMAMTIELAKLLQVNPYDQPEVEEYKSNIKI